MKLKSISKEESIYDTAKNNENILNTHDKKISGDFNNDKYEYYLMTLFSLVYNSGFYDEVKEEIGEEDNRTIIEKMFEKASLKGEFSTSIDIDINLNDIIYFGINKYIVIDYIKYKNETYLYLINADNYLNDIAIVNVKKENGKFLYYLIKSDEEFNEIINNFFLKSKEKMILFAIEE